MVVVEAIAAAASVLSVMTGATGIYRKTLFPRRYLRKRMSKKITQVQLGLETKLIQNPNLEEDLKRATKNCGVFVFWAPPDTGKTTYLSAFGAQLQAEGQDVIFIDAPPRIDPEWFRKELDLAESDTNLSELFPEAVHDKPVVIIMDQFDDIQVTEQKGLIVDLVQQSFKTRKFMVILAVSNASKAAEILRWHHNKIKLLGKPERYKWSETMVAELFATVNDPRRDQFINLGTIGGVVGELIPILGEPELVSQELLLKYQGAAQAHSLKWKSGAALVARAFQEAKEAPQGTSACAAQTAQSSSSVATSLHSQIEGN